MGRLLPEDRPGELRSPLGIENEEWPGELPEDRLGELR